MIRVTDLFKIGIGPSSSHTVGPMRAACAFAVEIPNRAAVGRIEVVLFGSLAWTGHGHGTDKAVMLGLSGLAPDTVDPDRADALVAEITKERVLRLAGQHAVPFDPARDIVFDRHTPTPRHPNTLELRAFGRDGALLRAARWCSVGGGFVVREDDADAVVQAAADVPHPFRSGRDLLRMARESGLSIPGVVRANEIACGSEAELGRTLDSIVAAMMACIDRGMRTEGMLPGGLQVWRRAPGLRRRLDAQRPLNARPPHEIMDHVSLFAIAVNEENAAGGRVVTAPTNGAAGVMPAVLRYYRDMIPGATAMGLHDALLAATAVGALCKMNASISGAEIGCQGEVGVASAMAAAGLAAALGATGEQIENAAEIGIEHHLGMTCDPVGGLVQIPCIERNAFGAVKAINAASLAMHGTGAHHISLDQAIATMRQTGADMHGKYKETSQGGLAVSYTEC